MSRKFLLVCTTLIFLFNGQVRSQSPKIDSLLNEVAKTKKDTTKINLYLSLSFAYWSISPKKMKEYLDAAEKLLSVNKHPKGEARFNNMAGVYYWAQGDYENALHYYSLASEKFKVLGNKRKEAVTMINIGQVYLELENFSKSLDFFNAALTTLDNIKGSEGDVAEIYNDIGVAYKKMGNYEKSLANYDKSIYYSLKLNDNIAAAGGYSNIGEVLTLKGDLDKAIQYQNNAYDIYSKEKNPRGVSITLFNLGKNYFKKKDYETSIAYLNKAFGQSVELNNNPTTGSILNALANNYLAMGQVDKSITYFQKSLAHMVAYHGENSTRLETYKGLAEAYGLKNEFEKSYRYQKNYVTLFDSLNNNESKKRIAEIQLDYELGRKDAEIKVMQKDQEVRTLAQYLVITILILGIISVLFLVNKLRREKELISKKKLVLELELKNSELEKKQLENEVEFKTRELTTYALSIIRKNELLEQIRESISELQPKGGETSKELSIVTKVIAENTRLDKDWEGFKMHFEKVHRNFFDNLLSKYPDITANEMKLVALLRLNLDSKEIARLMGTSADSVKVARHRLRKKLNLETTQNVVAFLNQF